MNQGITCPWCGTSYTAHRPNCSNCGGPLPLPAALALSPALDSPPEPPPAPRDFRRDHVWRKLQADGWAVVGAVFTLLGVIFGLTGLVLTVSLIGSFIGMPFTGLGIAFLAAGLPLLIWRHQKAQRTMEVLREGKATRGTIIDVYENYHVSVNNRHPWTIAYRFSVRGQEFEGRTTTLRTPGHEHESGQPVAVLFLENDPQQNTIYPPAM